MTHTIKHLFHINAKRSDVYKAITSIDGLSNWWTVDTKGDPSVGGTISFRFAENGGPDMKVVEMEPDEGVTWKCIESPHGWFGHTFRFILDDNAGKTRVRFTHEGWEEADDGFGICTFAWGRYMESLRQLLQTGRGEAFGSPGYRI